MNRLCEQLMGKMAKQQEIYSNSWKIDITGELENIIDAVNTYTSMLRIPLNSLENISNAKEIIKCFKIMNVLQKYYLIAYIKKSTREKRIDMKGNSYEKFYNELKREMKKDTPLSIEIKKYVRQGCEEYINSLWEEK